MLLTTNQASTLKTYILAQPDLAPKTSGDGTDYQGIVDALNADAAPTTLAWRTAVDPSAIDEAADYTVFDAIAAGKRDSWGFFLRFSRDFTRGKVRKWVTDVWGNATASSVSEAILQTATEKASRAEVAVGGTLRTTGTVAALARGFVGDISISDIASMFNAALRA